MFAVRRHPAAILLAAAGLFAVVLGAQARTYNGNGTPLADPFKCVEITDAQGNHINTTCVPWLVP